MTYSCDAAVSARSFGADNTLVLKLRKEFLHNNMTKAEELRRRMEANGTDTGDNVPLVSSRGKAKTDDSRDTRAESRPSRGNSLPHEKARSGASRSMRGIETTAFANTSLRSKAPSTRAQKPRSSSFITVAISLVCVALLMFLIYSGMQINRLNSQVNDLKQEVAQKENQRDLLAVEAERMLNLDEIYAKATELGMTAKEESVRQAFIDLSSGDTVDVYTRTSNLENAFFASFGN